MKRIGRSAAILLIGLPIVGMMVLQIWARTAQRPPTLGVSNGRLASCPDTPNCVSTQATAEGQRMSPLPYIGSRAETKAHLLQTVQAMPRVELIEEQENYLAFVFSSRLIGYPDDVEFYFDDDAQRIHFRSASRLGKGDMGVNRARMEQISQTYGALATAMRQ